jgi:hypothetical protein
VRIAFTLLVATFALYVLGVLDPLVPTRELVRVWSLPVERYVAATGAPTGWGWLAVLGKGDYLNFIGIALLATITLICYARVVPALPPLHAALALIQIAVLLAAALL